MTIKINSDGQKVSGIQNPSLGPPICTTMKDITGPNGHSSGCDSAFPGNAPSKGIAKELQSLEILHHLITIPHWTTTKSSFRAAANGPAVHAWTKII